MKYYKNITLAFFLFSTLTIVAQNKKEVTIQINKLSDNVYMLVGQGGNIGVSIGEDGVFMIDNQFARLSPKILAAIKTLSNKPIKFLVNTHWHGDHSGGNVNFQKEGATILAHDNVRKRIQETPNRDGTMSQKEAFPVITFNDKMNIHINGEKIAVFHSRYSGNERVEVWNNMLNNSEKAQVIIGARSSLLLPFNNLVNAEPIELLKLFLVRDIKPVFRSLIAF